MPIATSTMAPTQTYEVNVAQSTTPKNLQQYGGKKKGNNNKKKKFLLSRQARKHKTPMSREKKTKGEISLHSM
jgi:hypothetical protein